MVHSKDIAAQAIQTAIKKYCQFLRIDTLSSREFQDLATKPRAKSIHVLRAKIRAGNRDTEPKGMPPMAGPKKAATKKSR